MTSTDLNGKTCLVTGASGFVGSYLCHELIEQGAKIKALLHSHTNGIWDSSFVCKLGEEPIPDHLLDGVEVIFHLAGRAHSLADINEEDQLYYQTNVKGTRYLLEAARDAKVKKFIFFSSVKAMCEENDIRMDESFEPQPSSAYGKSKLEAERLVLDGGYVISPTVLRLVMVYGNTNKGNLPKMIKAISKNWFPPFPKIENKRSMIHVEDVVQAAILAASNEVSVGETYILSDGIDYSTRQLYEIIRQSMDKKIPSWEVPVTFLYLMAKMGDILRVTIGRRIIFDSDNLQKLIGSSYYSSKKAVSELGFLPKHTLFNAMPKIISSIYSK